MNTYNAATLSLAWSSARDRMARRLVTCTTFRYSKWHPKTSQQELNTSSAYISRSTAVHIHKAWLLLLLLTVC